MSRASGPVDSDEDGNTVPVPPAASDLAQLIQLLEYGRKRGFRIGPTVQIGALTVQVADLRQDKVERIGTPDENDPGPWRAAGYEGDDA